MAWCLLWSQLNLVFRHRCQEVIHDFHGNAVETIHTAERLFLLLIYMEALSLEKLNCTSFKDRKIFKNEWKVTERLTSWGFWLPIRLCCCSYHEKTIQHKIPVAVPFTLQVGIRERQDIKAEMNGSLAITEKDKAHRALKMHQSTSSKESVFKSSAFHRNFYVWYCCL